LSSINVKSPIPIQIYLILFFYCILFVSNIAVANPNVSSKKQVLSADIVPGELLVKFKQPFTSNKTRAKAGRFKARSKSQFKALGIELWKLDKSQNLENTIAQLQADPSVALVEPNYRRYPRMISTRAGHYTQDESRLNDLNLPKLWAIEETAYRIQNKVKVAVIDDAFAINHEDLQANIVLPYDAIDGGSDPSPEVCVIPGTNTPTYASDDPFYIESHGTLVAGVVGAVSNNSKGIDGAGDNASIIPIRIGCNYSVSYELQAFNYAIQQDVDIINISWGGPQFSEMERLGIVDLLKEDILIVTAAGNFDADNDRITDYPSGLDLPNILSVAAVSDSQVLLPWSQYGQTSVDIAAPGNLITTLSRNGSYSQSVRGTSFSAPFVAGVAASLLARSSEQTSALDLKAAIMASATPFSDGLKARLATDGYVDAYAAYEALINPAPLPVISKIEIDDSADTGNDNGVVDPGEIVIMKITLDNVGLKADSISAILSSSTLGGIKTAFSNDFPGFDRVNYQYGRVVLEFIGVDFSEYYQVQNVDFTLHLTSHYGVDELAQVSRSFTVDTGSLEIGKPVNNTIRSNDDNQDEFHYYHVNLDNVEDELVITLTMAEQNYDIDILVKYDSPPQFSYEDYENATILDKYEIDTKSGFENGNDETVTIKNPSIGTYHIVVIADDDIKESDMAYTITAKTTSNDISNTAAGCSIGQSNKIDPLFYFLLIISLWRISRYPQKISN